MGIGVGVSVDCKVGRVVGEGVSDGISVSLAANPGVPDLVTNHITEKMPNMKKGNVFILITGIIYAMDNVSMEWLVYRQFMGKFKFEEL